jgi:acyl-CoA dehydrogenase
MKSVTSEIELLLGGAERLFRGSEPLKRLRTALAHPDGEAYSRELWREGAAMGLTGLLVPEAMGGAGLGVQEAAAVAELCGRHLLPEPYLSTCCIAAPMLVAANTPRAQEVLTDICRGSAVVAVGVPGASALDSRRHLLLAHRDGQGWSLAGECPMVLDAAGSDWVLLPATGGEGECWFLLPTEGLERIDGWLVDGRRASRVSLSADVSEEAVLGVGACAGELTETMLVLGAVLVAAWLLGAAIRACEITLEHLRSRRQFGVALGSFQALQHRMARVYCEIEVTRASVEAAARAIDADADSARLLASAAKARAAATAELAGAEGIQMHGALGMTNEADIGFYYKEARLGDLLAGPRHFHRDRAARFLGLIP